MKAHFLEDILPSAPKKVSEAWFVYVLECESGALYTGIAKDVDKRFAAHRIGRGARYTARNKPKRVLGKKLCSDRSAASKMEYAIKQLKPLAKRALVLSWDKPAKTATVKQVKR